MYRLKLERFEGPLDLLLKLVEQNELNITDVSLSQVTEQYLEYLDKAVDLRPEEMADFLVVAAKLLLLKSRVLLPELFIDDQEEDGGDLIAQLAIYKLYLEASQNILRPFQERQFSYARAKAPKLERSIFSPPNSLSVEAMQHSFVRLLETLEEFVRPAPEIISRTISLRDRISVLRKMFEDTNKLDFRKILSDAKTRTEVIVSFLALLELVKQRHVMVHQETGEENIIITRLTTTHVN